METAVSVGRTGTHHGRLSAVGSLDEHVVYLTRRLCVLEASVTQSIAALHSALNALQHEKEGEASCHSRSAWEDSIDARLDMIEQKVKDARSNMTSDLGGLREGVLQAEISAFVLPALATATQKWAGALETALEMTTKQWTAVLDNAIERMGHQLGRLCDETTEVAKNGRLTAERVVAMEAMALYAAPRLHKKFIQGR